MMNYYCQGLATTNRYWYYYYWMINNDKQASSLIVAKWYGSYVKRQSISSLCILSCESLDSSPSIILKDRQSGNSVLINCGEGCQRSLVVGGMNKIKKIEKICVTGLSHAQIGGLPGILLSSSKLTNETTSTTNNYNTATTASAATITNVQVIGPAGTAAFVHSLRHFVRWDKNFSIQVHDVKEEEPESKTYSSCTSSKDDYFNITTIPATFQQKNSNIHVSTCSYIFTTPTFPGKFSPEKAIELGLHHSHLYGELIAGRSVTFAIDKTQQRKQQDYDGSSSTSTLLSEEKTIYLQDVLSPSINCTVAVLYCPNKQILVKLEESKHLQTFITSSSSDDDDGAAAAMSLDCIVHLTPHTMFYHDTPYQAFLKSFGKNVQHIFIRTNDDDDPSSSSYFEDECSPYQGALRESIKRYFLQPQIFPIPLCTIGHDDDDDGKDNNDDDDKKTIIDDDEFSLGIASMSRTVHHSCDDYSLSVEKVADASCTANTNNIVIGRPLMEYTLLPKLERVIDMSNVRDLSLGSVSMQEVKELYAFVQDQGALDAALHVLSPETQNHTSISYYYDNNNNNEGGGGGELIITGTGASSASKHRNVTGMCLKGKNGSCIMLDVGEGTLGQLYRTWGGRLVLLNDNSKHKATTTTTSTDKITQIWNTHDLGLAFDQLLLNINAVWISHEHADHHLGLLRLLSERGKRRNPDTPPLTLIASTPVLKFLEEYCKIDHTIFGSYLPVDCRDVEIHRRSHLAQHPLIEKLKDDLGITDFYSIRVPHSRHSYAVVLDGTAFGRVVYSGDCRPSDKLCNVADSADLLIHEATFEDGMEQAAARKNHCTISEALRVGNKMKAKAVLLTHFSQRYPKIVPPSSNHGSNKPLSSLLFKEEGVHSKNDAVGGEQHVIFAFDSMILRPDNLAVASKLTPALRLLYTDNSKTTDTDHGCEKEEAEEEEMEEKKSTIIIKNDVLIVDNETAMRSYMEQQIKSFLKDTVPFLYPCDIQVYAKYLVGDGFDSAEIIMHELQRDDLYFMKKAHQRAFWSAIQAKVTMKKSVPFTVNLVFQNQNLL